MTSPQPISADTTVSVRLSGGDWVKIFAFAFAQLIGALIWAVTVENRVGNLESKSGSTEVQIERLVSQGETLTRIDERTKEFDKRFERIERSVTK